MIKFLLLVGCLEHVRDPMAVQIYSLCLTPISHGRLKNDTITDMIGCNTAQELGRG